MYIEQMFCNNLIPEFYYFCLHLFIYYFYRSVQTTIFLT